MNLSTNFKQAKKLSFIVLITLLGCSSGNTAKKQQTQEAKPNTQKTKQVSINLKTDKNSGTLGDVFKINFESSNSAKPDSVKIKVNNRKSYSVKMTENFIQWDSKNGKTGNNQLHIKFYWGDSVIASNNIKFKLQSDIIPGNYTYKIKNTFEHSHRNYTQGLEFNNGFLYEGTGQYGESMLFKSDIDKNEVIQSLSLAQDVFGEGITILENKIYQITWQSQLGFVYDKNSFDKLYDFSYPTEGWGLTNNGKELIMSDGSENIYFLDTEFMQETRKLEVYDHKGPIKNLNELEYIDGLIYANVYGSDIIVAIDAKNGKVLKRINLQGILSKKDVKHQIDVLNGIAWDKDKQRLLVTGKWWPKLFEIELIEKQ